MAVIGGNLAFGMGGGELINQHPAQEILQEMLWKMLWEIQWEMLWEILWEILLGEWLGEGAHRVLVWEGAC